MRVFRFIWLPLCLLSACHHTTMTIDKTSFAAHQPYPHDAQFDAVVTQCHYIIKQVKDSYVSAPEQVTITTATGTDFVPVKVPSIYDVIFQHKGAQALISYCLTRHGYPKRSTF